MEEVPDHLENGLQIVFIGFNPSIRSGELGHHYANPRNNFWRILQQSGLTPRLYEAAEDGGLLKLGYGFTNIVARPTVGAEDITREEYTAGREQLRGKLEQYRPQIACFVGKGSTRSSAADPKRSGASRQQSPLSTGYASSSPPPPAGWSGCR